MKIPELNLKNYQIITPAIFVIICLGFLEFYLGYMVSLAILYLLPISFGTWYKGKIIGIVFSFLSVLVWFIADLLIIREITPVFLIVLNGILRLTFFIFVTYLLTIVKDALDGEHSLARKDFLTDTWNRMAFYEILETENDRAKRYKHPLTLVYLDLDNFKKVNDLYGHETGDKLLVIVTKTVLGIIRKTDFFARLGGDEFALLLPETKSDAASILLKRIQQDLLQQMSENDWGVTFSIGILTVTGGVISVNNMIKEADELMYSVKKSGKNNISQKVL